MAVPPDFVAGQVLTAAQMNAIGLWEIKSQTIGSAVSSVTVTGAFSADYDSYRIIVSGGSASTLMNLNMTLGSTVTGYYLGGQSITYAGVSTAVSGTNVASWVIGASDTNGHSLICDLSNPFLADQTIVYGSYVVPTTTSAMQVHAGFLNNTTSYTAFTLTTSSGTITGGTIKVYGYRN